MEAWRKQLYHTGIPGMKWGVRNGPPYPLGVKDMSASERRERKDKSQKKKKGLTDKQKRTIAIAAGVTVTSLIAGYAGYRLYKNGALDKFLPMGQNKVDELARKKVNDILPKNFGGTKDIIDSETGFKKIVGNQTLWEQAKDINPSHRQDNCKECSFTYAQKVIHGIDVSVDGERFSGNLRDFVGHYCQGDPDTLVRPITADGSNAQQRLEKQLLKKFKDGDIGAVGFDFDPKYRKPGINDEITGHVFNWIIENGKVKYIDSQGDKKGNLKDPTWLFGLIDPSKDMEYVNYREAVAIQSRLAKIMSNRI